MHIHIDGFWVGSIAACAQAAKSDGDEKAALRKHTYDALDHHAAPSGVISQAALEHAKAEANAEQVAVDAGAVRLQSCSQSDITGKLYRN